MGIIWLVIMWLAWGLWAFFEKLASDKVGIAATFLVSCIVALPLELYYISQVKQIPPIKDMLYPRLATLCGMTGSIAYLYACKYIKGSIAVAVQSLYPLCTVFLFIVICHEQLTRKQVRGIVLAAISVLLMV